MVASCSSPRFVPAEFLHGATCLLPDRSAGGWSPAAAMPQLPALTQAERAVLVLVLAGHANKEIAALLAKAEPTVKHQVSAILRKTGLPSRARLIAALR